MNSRYYRLQALILAASLVGSCKEDPTANLAGGPAGVELEFSLQQIAVDAEGLTTAVVRDALGTPLEESPTFTSRDPTVATVTVLGRNELRQTQFRVRGLRYGSTYIVATAANQTDSMEVETFPASIDVEGSDTATSGQTRTYTAIYRSATGVDITAQVPPVKWTSGATAGARVNGTTGAATFQDFGAVDVIATGPGVGDSISGRRTVLVSPAAFAGATTPDTLRPSGIVKITPAGGLPFTASTRVFFNRVPVDTQAPANDTIPNAPDRITHRSADSILVRIGDLATARNVELVVSRVPQVTGPDTVQLSLGGDSITIGAPLVPASLTPRPVYPGGTISIKRALTEPALTGARLYYDGTRVRTSGFDRIVSITADSILADMSDLRDTSLVTVRVTRTAAPSTAIGDTVRVRAPETFTGAMLPNLGVPGDVVVLTRGSGQPVFDGAVRAFFGGAETFVDAVSADTLRVAVPVIAGRGAKELRVTRVGPAQVAIAGSFNDTTFSFNDRYDVAGNNNPTSAPLINANGNFYVVLHGACHDAGDGIGVGGTDCDDFFRIENTGGTDAIVTINVDWATSADVDLYVLDDGLGFVDGSFFDQPEEVTVTIPAGATWVIWLNLFDNDGNPHNLTKVNISGLP